MTAEGNPGGKKGRRGRARAFYLTRLALLAVFIALGIPAGYLFARMIERPLVEKLYDYRPDIITQILDRNGERVAEYSLQKRIVIESSEMSPHLKNAIVAIEDKRFYEHGGIDPISVLRAVKTDLILREKAQGASTITQQLAKQIFLTPEKSWTRKFNEAFLAVEMEKTFTKDQILEMYANQIFLGEGAYGVEAASRIYFGKTALDLDIAEAALIAALIQRPSDYSPISNGNRVIPRRNTVLNMMAEQGYISEQERKQARSKPIILRDWEGDQPGAGGYFTEQVRQYLQKNYGTEGLYRGGLVVETTLDLALQDETERALRKNLRRLDRVRGFRKPERNIIDEGGDPATWSDPRWREELEADEAYPAVVLQSRTGAIEARLAGETITLDADSTRWTRRDVSRELREGDVIWVRFEEEQETRKWYLDQYPALQGAVVVLDVPTGEVRALVGGYDFRDSKFNRAVQSSRQVGSAFKPFVFGAAFEKGYTPADTVFDAVTEFELDRKRVYTPRNYTGTYEGVITIQRALELSVNVPAVKVMLLIGIGEVIDFTRRSGISADLPEVASLALGPAGIPPIQMAAAFNSFANGGVHAEPRMLRRVKSSEGQILEETYPELQEATTEQVAYVLTHAMQAVVRRGTGFAAHTLPGVYAGKTGTTNGYTDAWFVGYSPEYTIAVWVGYDDPRKSLGRGSTGGEVALPIWMDVFKAIDELGLRGEPKQAFAVPPGVVSVSFDLKTGRRAEGPCGRVVQGVFITGTEPEKNCWGEIYGTIPEGLPLDPELAAEPSQPDELPPAEAPTGY